jgi:hypothetical protein
MKDQLPVPAFTTEEEQLAGAKAIVGTGDTTTENVVKAVPIGTVLMDTNLIHARYLKKEGDLLYHIFRGESVPTSFWGGGEFGLLVLEAAETAWPNDKPLVEFHQASVRQEAVEDDPTTPAKYPECYYGSYLVVIPGVDKRPLPPDEQRFKRMIDLLEQALVEASGSWSNGS